MNVEGRTGYAYRRASVEGAALLALARELLAPGPLWSFGGAAQWDFVRDQGRDNLRRIRQLETIEAHELAGDFGHLFGPGCEVRWRRLDDGSYDALVLCETPLGDAERDRLELRQIGAFAATTVPVTEGLLLDPGDGARRAREPRLGLVEYRDPVSLALRLVRYSEWRLVPADQE